MDAIEPVYGTATLLIIAAAAVALLLFLIMKVKLHAFVSLVLVSLLTAVAAGIPIVDVPNALLSGFGGTLGSVTLLVAFGVMLGRLLELTGGAQGLADTLINRFGEKRAPMALGIAALIFGFPIFFDAGLVVFLPIILTVARRFDVSDLLYALPAAGAFAAMHAIVPPHPGPVAAVDLLGGNVGPSLLFGIPVAVAAWYVGVYLVSKYLGARFDVPVSDLLFSEVNSGTEAGSNDGTEPGAGKHAASTTAAAPPAFGIVLGLLALPLILISLNTIVATLRTAGQISEDAEWADYLLLLAQTPVALLITVLAAIVVLGRGRFSLADSLSGLGFSLILQAFLIATALRVAQGSATVALTTTRGSGWSADSSVWTKRRR